MSRADRPEDLPDFGLNRDNSITAAEFREIFGRSPRTPNELKHAKAILGPWDPLSQGYPLVSCQYDEILDAKPSPLRDGRGGPWERSGLRSRAREHTAALQQGQEHPNSYRDRLDDDRASRSTQVDSYRPRRESEPVQTRLVKLRGKVEASVRQPSASRTTSPGLISGVHPDRVKCVKTSSGPTVPQTPKTRKCTSFVYAWTRKLTGSDISVHLQ